MIGMVQSAQNPQMAINQMAMNNPQMQQVMQYINQNGGDAKTAFFALAKQKGRDPTPIIQQVQRMMK